MFTDANFFIAIAVIALLGFLLGFGKILRFFTSGIFGIIISIIACAMLGGTLQQIPSVAAFITNINNSAAEALAIFKYIYPGLIIYYLILFLSVQIIRKIIVSIIRRIIESDNFVVRALNKVLGTIFAVGFSFALLLLVFAFIEVFANTQFGIDFIEKLGDGIFKKIYDFNPINFAVAQAPPFEAPQIAPASISLILKYNHFI
jgi:hypothetical protein